VPRDETHLVVRAMQAAFEQLGLECPGLSLQAVNTIPHGRGLGSSAAAIVAGVLAATGLVAPTPPDREWVLRLASEIEGHPDNVAACLLGGLTIAWTAENGTRAARVGPSPDLAAVAFIPTARLTTSTARALLPGSVPHGDAAHSAGRAALLVEALSRRPDLLHPATDDRLHQQYRAVAMPESAALLARLRSSGVAAVVSGAGPTILALLAAHRDQALARVPELTDVAGPGWAVEVMALDVAGAQMTRS
jgi:homoserine kinase